MDPSKISLNPTLGVPLYRQIVERTKEMIAAGVLKPGDKLPSIRELASALRINPSSAVKAYSELQHAGIIQLDQGRGTFVSDNQQVVEHSRDELLQKDLTELLIRAESRGFSPKDVERALKQAIAAQKGRGQ
jgi:GntR family transcriptional regulator